VHCEVAFGATVAGEHATATEVMVAGLVVEERLPPAQLANAVKHNETKKGKRWRAFTEHCSWRGGP